MLDSDLLRSTTRETLRLLRRAEARFGVAIPRIEIRYDLKGTAAGMVMFPYQRDPLIRYNPLLLQHNRQAFLSQTLPHEVAHLIARALHGKSIRPHGSEWKTIMAFFGADPLRCHDYATDHLPVRKLRRFPYACDCRQHQLSSIRHNRIQQGQTYCCRLCGKPLRAVVN